MMQYYEISLFELWQKLREGWLAVVGGTVLGITGAVLAIFLIPPKYESVAIFQIGKVAGNAIESPEVVAARVSTPAFRLEVAQKVGDEELIEELTNDASKVTALGASVVKGTALMMLVTRNSKPDEASKLSGVAVQALQLRHTELGQTLVNKINNDIVLSKEKLMVVEKELDELSKTSMGSTNVKDSQFAPVSLLTSMRVQKQAEVFGLRQQLYSMELSLLPPATLPTQVIEPPYVAQRPVSPKKGLLLALGAIGGLLASVLWVFSSRPLGGG